MKKILNGILYYICVMPATALLSLYYKAWGKDKAVFLMVVDNSEVTNICQGKPGELGYGFYKVFQAERGLYRLLRMVLRGYETNWDSVSDGDTKNEEQCTEK